MIVSHAQYAAWQMRCDAFHEIICEENTEWVPPLVSFTTEIETKCPDGDIVGHARSARRQAIAFSDTKSHERAYTFNGFLASLLRLSTPLGIILTAIHDFRDSSRTKHKSNQITHSKNPPPTP